MSAFERAAVQRVLDKADSLGVQHGLSVDRICGTGSGGALLYARAHPEVDEHDPDLASCCYGAANGGISACTCWQPVYDVEQAPPNLDGVVLIRDRACGDCAYRKDSPERAEAYSEEMLLELPATGQPFWCHDGMRRPVAWEHPTLGRVDGDPDDWQPKIVRGVPFRADGQPALLCAGWAVRVGREGDNT